MEAYKKARMGKSWVKGKERRILKDTQQVMEECAKHVDLSTIMSFKNLLSWKIPENLSNANTKDPEESLETKVAGQASNAGGDLAKRLYKVDYITQRIKEQKIHMVGIVVSVKQYVRPRACLFL